MTTKTQEKYKKITFHPIDEFWNRDKVRKQVLEALQEQEEELNKELKEYKFWNEQNEKVLQETKKQLQAQASKFEEVLNYISDRSYIIAGYLGELGNSDINRMISEINDKIKEALNSSKENQSPQGTAGQSSQTSRSNKDSHDLRPSNDGSTEDKNPTSLDRARAKYSQEGVGVSNLCINCGKRKQYHYDMIKPKKRELRNDEKNIWCYPLGTPMPEYYSKFSSGSER